MILVNCPEYPSPEMDGYPYWGFLAGGITGCEDWQTYAIKRLRVLNNSVILNPRRANFDVTDPSNEQFQIKWEHQMIMEATNIMFWFPKETLCPITLFELGKWLGMGRSGIVVGCDPEYKRRNDVKIQTQLMKPYVKVHDSLDDTINAMILEMR